MMHWIFKTCLRFEGVAWRLGELRPKFLAIMMIVEFPFHEFSF